VYIFRFTIEGADNYYWEGWSPEATLKLYTQEGQDFGYSVALSADGNTLAVVAKHQLVAATDSFGAVYIYRFDGMEWSQRAYLKSPSPSAGVGFGNDVALSADANTLAVSGADENTEVIFLY
jgi:hypothetical protein